MPKGRSDKPKSKLYLLTSKHNFLRGRIQGTVKALRLISNELGRRDIHFELSVIETKLLASCDIIFDAQRKDLFDGTSKTQEEPGFSRTYEEYLRSKATRQAD